MRRDGDEEWGRSDRPLDDLEREVDDEIAFHMEMRARENASRGMDPTAARRAAERRFGDVEDVRRELTRVGRAGRRARVWRDGFGNVLLDLRLAVRTLRRRPVFTVATALTLALGVAASTVVFSVANRVLLRPVPGVHDPDALITVTVGIEPSPEASFAFGHRAFLELEGGGTVLEGLAASQTFQANIALPGGGAPARVSIEYVSGGFARVLGLRAQAGRVLAPSDGLNPYVVMIGDRLWSTLFDRSRSAVGASLIVNGARFTVVGVAPREFSGTGLLRDAQLWVPVEAGATILAMVGADALASGDYPIWLELAGRLGSGATRGQAAAQLDAVVRSLRRDPAYGLPAAAMVRVRPGIGLSPWEQGQLASVFRVLGVAVSLLILLACANAANLMLARTGARRTELEIRRAIGAGRARVIRLVLSEAAVLVALAGLAGVAIAAAALRLLDGARLLTFMPPMGGIELDQRVLLFAFGVTLVTGLIFGVAPSLVGSVDAAGTLRSGRRNVRRTGPSHVLVVVQLALSAVLLVGSGLLLQTLRALGHAELGFDPRGTMEASVDAGAQGYDGPRREQFFRELLQRARRLPDVSVAGLAQVPVQGQGMGVRVVRLEGVDSDDASALTARTNEISPGFLDAIGATLVAGRDFREDEMYGPGPGVAILGETAARQLFGNRIAIGRRIDLGANEPRTLEVVGVIRDARIATLREPGGALVLEPFGQAGPSTRATLYTRAHGGSQVPADALRDLLRDLDPTLPFYDVQPLGHRVAASAVMERMLARLTTTFAIVALILAAIGLYGMMAMLVQGRAREVGVRLALGATPTSVRILVLGHGMRLAGFGLVLGLLASTRATRLLSARLWGVGPLDPVAFAAAAVVLAVVAFAACWEPAVRATRVEPVDVLTAD